eukprot:gene10514-4765_t
MCCAVQPVHPCPGNALHDEFPALLQSRSGLERTLREAATPILAMQKDGGTLPASIARFMSDDPVGQAGHRCGCSEGCRCVETVRKTRTWCHEDGHPPAFVLAVLGRFGGCVRDGRVGLLKNLSRVALSDANTDAAVTLIEGQCQYLVEVEVLHTQPTLDGGHWITSGRFEHSLHMWDDATVTPLQQPLAATQEGQNHLYAALYRRSDIPPPPRRPRPLVNPHRRNWCPFNATLITIAAAWHELEPGLRLHGPVTRALVAVMRLMFLPTAPLDAAVGTLPGELAALTHFVQMFHGMRPEHAQGSQLPMYEVWAWLTAALRTEHYAWRNVAFYRGFVAAEPAGFFFEDLCRPLARGGKAGDYDWLESHHGWVQWAFPTMSQGRNYHSAPLTAWEADVFRADSEIRRRGLRVCAVFLDFLGLQFTGTTATPGVQSPPRTGGIRVSRNVGGGWEVRARNWEQNAHNNLRVTRMLEFLRLVGCTAHASAFVVFVTVEVAAGEMRWCRDALRSHWLPCVDVLREGPPPLPPGRFAWAPVETREHWGTSRLGPAATVAQGRRLHLSDGMARVLGDEVVRVDHTGAQYTALMLLPVPARWAHFTLQGTHPYAGSKRTLVEHNWLEYALRIDPNGPVLLARER